MTRILLLTLTFIALVTASLPALSQTLTPDQFRAEIVGKKLETKRLGLTARLVFFPDGRVAMQAAVGAGKGTWTVQGDEICVTMTSGPRTGKRCGMFRKLDEGKYANSEGQVFRSR